MQDIWYMTPVKGSFDPKGVMTHRLKTIAIGSNLFQATSQSDLRVFLQLWESSLQLESPEKESQLLSFKLAWRCLVNLLSFRDFLKLSFEFSSPYLGASGRMECFSLRKHNTSQAWKPDNLPSPFGFFNPSHLICSFCTKSDKHQIHDQYIWKRWLCF
jgi:hypothetical protein